MLEKFKEKVNYLGSKMSIFEKFRKEYELD
jgi:hypothetical protein